MHYIVCLLCSWKYKHIHSVDFVLQALSQTKALISNYSMRRETLLLGLNQSDLLRLKLHLRLALLERMTSTTLITTPHQKRNGDAARSPRRIWLKLFVISRLVLVASP